MSHSLDELRVQATFAISGTVDGRDAEEQECGEFRPAGGEGEGVGDFVGTAVVAVQEFGCALIWDATGSATSDMDLRWETTLVWRSASTCTSVADPTGILMAANGAMYFDGDYWGLATYGGGGITWATPGYITGVGGYNYYDSGFGSY